MTIELSTLETIPGAAVERHLGLVTGTSIQAKHFGKDFFAGVKNMLGGELTQYSELLNEARDEALRRMTAHAQELGADAVVAIRFTTSTIAVGAAEFMVYGSAVKLARHGL